MEVSGKMFHVEHRETKLKNTIDKKDKYVDK